MALEHKVVRTLFLLAFPGITMSGPNVPPAIAHPRPDDTGKFFVTASQYRDVILNCEAERPDQFTSVGWRRSRTLPLQQGWSYANDTTGTSFPTLPFLSGAIRLSSQVFKDRLSYFEGTYECFVNNSFGMAVSGPVTLLFRGFRNAEHLSPPVQTGAILWSTLVLSCSSNGSMSFYPSLVGVKFIVNWTVETGGQEHNIGALESYKDFADINDSRVTINEEGTLYIRRITDSEGSAPEQTKIYKCSMKDADAPGYGVTLGKYSLTVFSGLNYDISARLVYKTKDQSVAAGDTLYMTCVFEETGVIFRPVQWKGPSSDMKAQQNGNVLMLSNVGTQHSGDWQCMYEGARYNLTEVIKITVIEYPVVETQADAYTVTGSDATITCRTRNRVPAAFQWFFNDESVVQSLKRKMRLSQISADLTIVNASKSDIGVLACAAANVLGTMKSNLRFIVYDKGKIHFDATDQAKNFVISVNETLHLSCSYTLDDSATEIEVFFKLQKKPDLISAVTNDPQFGLLPSAVVKTNATVVSLILTGHPETIANLEGLCTCIVRYKIFNNQFEDTSNAVNIVSGLGDNWMTTSDTNLGEFGTATQAGFSDMPKGSATDESPTEQLWWIGVVIFSVALIGLVLSATFVHRRRLQNLNNASNSGESAQPPLPELATRI